MCEQCFLCRSFEFCKMYYKCPDCCSRPTCRGQIAPVLGKMGSPGVSPKVVTVLREGYSLRFWPNLTQSQAITGCYLDPNRNLYLEEALHQLLSKDAVEPVTIQKSLGFYNKLFHGSKTQQPVETYPRPQYPEQISKDRVIQNGDTRDNKNLPIGRGVGYLHRFQRRILPYTNSKSIQEVHVFSRKCQSYQF